ncbi:MAG: hypothetical protein KIT72_03705 [Polyangiaceae bacterium]|nr:hypothetical protein [Polyangiaceae bacterium]MCW5789507.1 hypothetical protein [Polyangiaceae bacterium]
MSLRPSLRLVRWVSAGALLAGAAASGAACSSKELALTLVDPCQGVQGFEGFRSRASYVEFAVFESECPNNTCGDLDPQLALGNTQGALKTSLVPINQALPSIGDLPVRKYAFAAVLKDDTCKPIAYGCTCADVEDISKVEINVAAWSNCSGSGCSEAQACTEMSAPGCVAPAACVNGRCDGDPDPDSSVPPDASDDNPPTGPCSLRVIASGALPAPISDTAALSGPAVTATDAGFVIGYREQHPDTTAMQAVLQGVSDSGSPSSPSKIALGNCSSTPSDGVGIASQGSAGLMVVSLPECGLGNGAGAAFITFGANGARTGDNTLRNPGFTGLTLARGQSLVPVPSSSSEYELVYRAEMTSGAELQGATLEGLGFKGNARILLGAQPVDFGQIALTSAVSGILGQITGGSSMLLRVGPPGGATVDVALPAASWGAITAYTGRVAVMVPEGSGVTYSLTDSLGADLGTGTISVNDVRGGDVVALNDRLLMLTASTGNLTIHRFTGAATTPVAGEQAPFLGSVGSTSLSGFQGELVGMAAARNRVAMAWLTRSRLQSGDSVGGWAVLECAN